MRPIAERFGSSIIVPCDVRESGQLEAVYAHIRNEWGHLDFFLHSIAYAPKEDLDNRVTDCSQAGFAMAMDVSCHSFIRMARLAETLMANGGCLLTVTKALYCPHVSQPDKVRVDGVSRGALNCI